MTRSLLAIGLALAALLSGSARAEGTDEPRHPEPRVIVDVVATKKSKTAAFIQAAARRGFWGKAVACYKRTASSDPKLEVDATLRATVRGGKVTTVELVRPRRAKKGKASNSQEVAGCLAERLVGLPMPKGVRTTATLRVRIAPGDDPITPP